MRKMIMRWNEAPAGGQGMANCRRLAVALASLAIAILPGGAGADYLYSMERNIGPKPYVLFLADNSGSMSEMDANTNCCSARKTKDCPRNQPRCDTRMNLLRNTLTDLIPKLDGVSLGLMKYGVTVNRDVCGLRLTDPLPTTAGGSPRTTAQLLDSVASMAPESYTPIAQSLESALEHLRAVRAADEGASCRKYVVVMLTDGEPNCARTGKPADRAAWEAADALAQEGIPTYVIGFGAEVSQSTFLTELARRGGTARIGDRWCQPVNGRCSTGTALTATQGDELSRVLQETFEQIQSGEFSPMGPIISTVAQQTSEVDRVSRNFLAYSAFEQPGYKGHLYGIRLFEEKSDQLGKWKFTNLEEMDLDRCGETGNPCLFDAGKLLFERVAPRSIFSATPASSEATELGGLTLRFQGRVAIEPPASGGGARVGALIGDVLDNEALRPGVEALDAHSLELLQIATEDTNLGDQLRNSVAGWLHGELRDWPLGDLYHSAPSIAGPPPYSYRTRGYPIYKAALRRRPDMIYVGANDGMIHAFHAGPDLFQQPGKTPRWQPGEEAWSFLPYNLVVRTALAAMALPAEKRFFSQDLSCRLEDVLTVDNMASGSLKCPDGDPYCGWRTLLVCGQGWGGSWYVTLDVTDPFDPQPLWESTHGPVVEAGGTSSYGAGRSWGVPSVAVVNVDQGEERPPRATWLALYGSGYNTDMRDAAGGTSASYRLLNMPFAGAAPHHGDGTQGEHGHVFVQDLATGSFVKVFHHHGLEAVLADLPVVDLDHDSFADTVYVGGWKEGRIDRISFASEGGISAVDDWTNACTNFVRFGAGNPITSRPAAFSDPAEPGQVYLFVGTGIDKGAGPDEQRDITQTFDFRAYHLLDDGSATCPRDPLQPDEAISSGGNICVESTVVDGKAGWTFGGIFHDGQRLMSAPVLVTQRDRARHLSFTTWRPDETACGEGSSSLYCVDVSQVNRCVPCGSLGGVTEEEAVAIELDGAKPTTPTSADGQLYTIGAKGPVRIGNQDGEGTGPDGRSATPNVNAPRSVVISWRDVF